MLVASTYNNRVIFASRVSSFVGLRGTVPDDTSPTYIRIALFPGIHYFL